MTSCASAEAIKGAATSSNEDITKPAYATPSPSEDPATITCIQDLSADILGLILNSIYTDAQVSKVESPGVFQSRKVLYGAWCVSKQWRDSLRACPINLANAMVATGGADRALLRAACCKIWDFDELELVRLMLTLGAKADCHDGKALLEAARHGHEAVVRLLLEWREHAPRADCQGGRALVLAARGGHEAVVRLLLEWREHAPRADLQGGYALMGAANYGHEAVVRLLLEWRDHAPRADCSDGEALVGAAIHGNEAVVRLLLDCDSAPRADCQGGRALRLAKACGHTTVFQILQDCCAMLSPA